MTFNEVLARVQWNVWGNTAPPANAMAMLQGANGIISRAHHKIQVDHNFWFMRTWAEILTVYDEVDEEYTQAYLLPDELKEIINFQWHIEDNDGNYEGFTTPLARLTDEQSQQHFWKNDNINSVEYPEYFEVVDNMIVFYPDGNCARTGVLNYWQYIECLLDDEEDDLMREGPEAVICQATSDVYLHLHEVDLSGYWKNLAREEFDRLRTKDYHKRRAHINEFGTQEGA